MQPRVTQVGPLAAPSANNICTSQTLAAAGALAINGTTANAVANNICLSQSGTAATALLLNGSLGRSQYVNPYMGVTAQTWAYLPFITTNGVGYVDVSSGPWNGSDQQIYITSAGNDSGITFAIVGLDRNFCGVSETIQGANASTSASSKRYAIITSITPSGNTASTVTAGINGIATLDIARRVIFTSGGNDSGITITISGTDWAGTRISETVTGGNVAAVSTVNDYLTIAQVKTSGATAGTMTVGTNGVAGSPWVPLDSWAGGTMMVQCVVSGTVNYTVQLTNDDPDAYANSVGRSAVAWDTSAVGANLINATSSQMWSGVPVGWARVVLNSQTNPGYVRMTFIQHLSAAL